MKNFSPKNSFSRGFVLAETVLALLIVGSVLAYTAVTRLQAVEVQFDKSVSDYQNTVASAAKKWLADNYAAVVAGSTANSPYVLKISTLKTAGYLPSTWSDTNPIGQTPCVLALQPQANRLQTLLVTEGGITLPLLRAKRIALGVGGEGGFVDPDTPAPLTARGGAGTYAIDLSSYASKNCSGVATASGRLVSALFFDNTQITAPFLYRNPVPGLPEANTMNTHINMAGNNINNAGQVNAVTVNATTVNATTVNATSDVSANCFVDRNNPAYRVCPSASSNLNATTGNTFAANQYYGRTNAAYYLTPDIVSNLNQVTAETLTAKLLVDKDNNAFYMNPSSTSVIQDSYVTNRSVNAKLSSLLGNFIETSVSAAVGDSTILSKPNCPDAGQPYIYLIPKNLRIGPDYVANHDATDMGAGWQVNIRNGSNLPIANGSVIAKIGCYYS